MGSINKKIKPPKMSGFKSILELFGKFYQNCDLGGALGFG